MTSRPANTKKLMVIHVKLSHPQPHSAYFLVNGLGMTLQEFVHRKLPSPAMVPQRVGHRSLQPDMWQCTLAQLLEHELHAISSASSRSGVHEHALVHECCDYPQLCLSDVIEPEVEKVKRGKSRVLQFAHEAEEI